MKGLKFPIFLKYEGPFSQRWLEVDHGQIPESYRWFVLLHIEDRTCVAIWDVEDSLRKKILENQNKKESGYVVVEKWLKEAHDRDESVFIFSHILSIVNVFVRENDVKVDEDSKYDAMTLFSVPGASKKLKEIKQDLQKEAPPSYVALTTLVPSLKKFISDIGEIGWAKSQKEKSLQQISDVFFGGDLVCKQRKGDADMLTGNKSSLMSRKREIVMKSAFVTRKFVPRCPFCISFMARNLKDPNYCETCMTKIQKSLCKPVSFENDVLGWLSSESMKQKLMRGLVTIDDILALCEKDEEFMKQQPEQQISQLSDLSSELKKGNLLSF